MGESFLQLKFNKILFTHFSNYLVLLANIMQTQGRYILFFIIHL